ncbi:MAG: hypothetical protein ACYCTE_11045 [Acidimicrobiales bacterium]
MEHDQPFGRPTGEDFDQLPGVVGSEEEDPVLMGGIAHDRVRYGAENVIVGEPVAVRTAKDLHLSIAPPNWGW